MPKVPLVPLALAALAGGCGGGDLSARDGDESVRRAESASTPQMIVTGSELLDRRSGFGGQATGGLNGVLYVVKSSGDDGSEGTLRYGVEQIAGPKWIVFDRAAFP